MKLKPVAQKIGVFAYQLAILALIFYIGYILFRQINLNYQTNLKINKFKQEIGSLKKQNLNLDNLLIYYQSNTYKELEARKRLGMKKAGETALVCPENKDKRAEEGENASEINKKQGQKSAKVSNYVKWLKEIFGKEGLILD